MLAHAARAHTQYYGRIFPAAPTFEGNDISHTQRGLLTKSKTDAGSEFFMTLGSCPDLDGTHVVFGRVAEGAEVLTALEQVPIYTK
jgi:cyclophilin family peptidyl-prolyl cis-trans isomerase